MSRSFDGVNDRIDAGTFQGPQAAMSYAMWLRPTSLAAVTVPAAQYEAGANAYFQIIIGTTGSVTFRLIDDRDVNYVGRRATNILSVNVWWHIAGTWSGGTTNASIKVYNDGVQADDADAGSGTFVAPNTASILNQIGIQAGVTTPANPFAGQIAHCHYYSVELTASEINQLMRFPGSIRRGLRNYWPLWGTSSPEPDYSGNRNNGTVTGATFSGLNPPVGRNFFMPKQRYVWIPAAPAGGALNIDLSESFTWSENLTKDFGKHLAEQITFSHNLTKDYLKHIIQSITWNDTVDLTLITGLIIALSETFTMTEAITKNYTKHLKEDYEFTHALTKDVLKHFTETVTFTESQTKLFTKHLTEVVTLTEAITKQVVKHLTENWTWNDSVTAQIVVVQASIAKLITFLHRGMLGRNDKQSMKNELTEIDQQEVNWDYHDTI